MRGQSHIDGRCETKGGQRSKPHSEGIPLASLQLQCGIRIAEEGSLFVA